MINLLELWFRGLVFTVAAIIAVTIAYGIISFVAAVPSVGLPIMVLVILPLLFGGATEAKE